MKRILVVDDDPASREVLRLALAKSGYGVTLAETRDAARARLDDAGFDLVISDLWLGEGTGIDLLNEVRRRPGAPPVILVTARGTVETAAIAARIGAFDYLAKPFDLQTLLARVAAALAPTRHAPVLVTDPAPDSLFVGAHPSMVELYKAVGRVAPLSIPVLVLGETGTGKELVARALHQLGASPDGPFVAVNCGAIPEGLLESELFGHVRGAFTDARRDHRGALARADGGTIFLDEIGEVSPSFQVQLLRFLEDGVVTPVGSERGETVRVRTLAATHRDLPALVGSGGFRADLYYRLAGYEIRVPPLRDRATDLPLLVEHFRRRAEREAALTSPGPATPDVLAALAECTWPGNVRQLELVVRRLLVDGGALADPALARKVLAGLGCGQAPTHVDSSLALDGVERRHVLAVLEATGGNRSEAARLLGIDRKTLRRKLERFGLALASDGDEEAS